ncbi:hypothetical protein K1T71_008091 [Dendrolimus kikuchii]|uniref:Uncharacterized protein n=1 Tax=Dendrolimus kikuchii TaxID=765133 RepID=A0ACC1CXC0_9NEOP|nr:hypothetical protein K1T71_008091 [Dendrolimus kikuchii]
MWGVLSKNLIANNKDTQLSKLLSWLLRHGAIKEGFSPSSEGYLQVNHILQHKSFRGKYNREDIERIVLNNVKQRFKLRVNPQTNVLEIKANQGHSIASIGVEDLKPILEPIYETVVHGTYLKCWPSVKQYGLSRMQRQHIHLAKGTPGNTNIISGVRNNAQIYIFINLKKALNEGLKFYESENGVILTPGNDQGYLEAKYFEKVVKASSGEALAPASPSPPSQAPATPQPKDQKNHTDSNNAACKVIVTGYPPYARVEDLILVLTRFGTVKVDKKERKQAIVTFSNEEEAKTAIEANRTMVIYGEYLYMKPYPQNGPQNLVIDPKSIDLSGDFYQQVDRVMAAVRLTQEDVNALSAVYVDLENILQTMWPGCQAIPFGSITTGLGIKTSDADCFILVPPQYRIPSTSFVNRAKRLLQMHPQVFTEVISIPRANTPIVKFFHIPTKMNCDVSFKTTLGVQNSKLIAFLLHADPRLIPLSVVIKYWAKVHGLSGTGKMTNYALTMMVIFYLQQPPISILPPIAWLQRDHSYDFFVDFWNTGFMGRRDLLPPVTNKFSISELLGGFFEFYSTFNFDEMVICPYLGVPIRKGDFKDFHVLPEALQRYKNNVINKLVLPMKNDTMICVQDPVEQSHNVASSITCSTAADIKAFIKFAASAYDKEKTNSCENFLRIILLQAPKLLRTKAHPEYRVNLFPKIVQKIKEDNWKTVIRDIVFVMYEKMLKIKLGKIEEKINPDSKKEKEKYMGAVTKVIWKRKKFLRLYDKMNLSFETKHERITQEILNVEKDQFHIQFQLILTYCLDPRSALVSMRLIKGDVDAYREFGKFFISIMQSWFENLLQPYIKVQDTNVTKEIAENISTLNKLSLHEGSQTEPSTEVIETDSSVSEDSS